MIPVAVEILRLGICDCVLGSRIRTRAEALDGGMPRYKYVANRMLTILENVALGQNLGDFHSGFRAYRREVLETIPWERNSNDFVFDSEFLAQVVHFGFKLGDIPVPVRYFDEASSINFGPQHEVRLLDARRAGEVLAVAVAIVALEAVSAALGGTESRIGHNICRTRNSICAAPGTGVPIRRWRLHRTQDM